MLLTGHNWKYIKGTLTCISQVLNESENNTGDDADALQQLEEIETSGVGHLDRHDHQHLSSDGFFCSSPSEMNVWLRL
jgi:flagellar motor component MotA